MTTNQELIAKADEVFLANYGPAPHVFTAGEKCRLRDVEGRWFLDLCAGIAVVSVGHGHPRLADAVSDQARRLMHVSNLFYNDRAVELAAELRARTPFQHFFFCNSGAEANEALLKLARRYHHEQGGKERTRIVSTHGSFHGRTLGALTLTGQSKYHEGMHPLVGDIDHVPYGDIEAMRRAIDGTTAAVFVEPIQGEGGIVVPPDDYLPRLRRLCDEAGALLMYDEVQTGYGRTGRFLASEWNEVVPDACSLAKGIGGGFPLGCAAVGEKLKHGLPPGSHATTFGGNALACAAGLEVLRIFDDEKLVQNAEQVGEHLRTALQGLVDDSRAAEEVRGKGLLQGLVLAQGADPQGVLARIRQQGVLLSLAGGKVLRFSPPLCVQPEEIDEGIEVVRKVLKEESVQGSSP